MDCVIFDCDGVLVDSEIIFVHAELEFLRSHGLHYELAPYIHEFVGMPARSWRERIAAEMAKVKGEVPHERVFDALDDALEVRLPAELKAVEGCAALLQSLHATKGVASSSTQSALEWKLAHTGLDRHFDDKVYSADLVTHGKPAPDLFLYAAGQLGADPGQCIAIEDSANGVKAARAAGMTTVGFTGASHCVDGHGAMLNDLGAEQVVDSFEELAVVLTALLR